MFPIGKLFTVKLILPSAQELYSSISDYYSIDESGYITDLVEHANLSSETIQAVSNKAADIITKVRQRDDAILMIDALLLQYSLDTKEGVLLMCLAESLMRIPDANTADALIKDKMSMADWRKHINQSDSLLVNASTWGLLLTGNVISFGNELEDDQGKVNDGLFNKMVSRLSEPVIRNAIYQSMKVMGNHFVLGQHINEALKNAKSYRKKGYLYSFDMLGEAAITMEDAQHYWDAYMASLERLGTEKHTHKNELTLSIKLSALHPRYESNQSNRLLTELFDSLLVLLERARELNIGITIDAEEADRLEISLDIFEKLYRHPSLKNWGQFGIVVQAYSKRALPVLAWLAALAKEEKSIIPVRLVKGAYWDSEIKHSQQMGLSGYPVYTRKEGTDVAYLACVVFLLKNELRGLIYPQFATHNAHTVASVLTIATHKDFEFQRLHGMGDALYNTIIEEQTDIAVRIYAPVGKHKFLLPYLVRRLLENGANSSFVHRLVDIKTPVENLTQHPAKVLRKYTSIQNDRIPLPKDIFGKDRLNSSGINLNVESQRKDFENGVSKYITKIWNAKSIIAGSGIDTNNTHTVFSPYDTSMQVGTSDWAEDIETNNALDVASKGFPQWNLRPIDERAKCLEKMAVLLEEHRAEFVTLCHREAGKTAQDAIDEIREAIDFCRYYAVQARKIFQDQIMPGPTGEENILSLNGRGVFVCISPWNFPLAIFLGQIAAALVTGNTVIAKPAEQTSLIAWRAVQLFLEAGIPDNVLQLLLGEGAKIGNILTNDSRVAGVVFTGSTDVAKKINYMLAKRDGPIGVLIAETGGQNAMLIDSTALPEQVVVDIVQSAFSSAGQRCSALRVLFVQDDIADNVINLLKGAMNELKIGEPSLLSTDIGPVIDQKAQDRLLGHINLMSDTDDVKLIAQLEVPNKCTKGFFVPPTIFEINSIDQLVSENFGPILHLIRYKSSELEKVIDQINRTGYGLTLGIHTRNEKIAAQIASSIKVGNVYINRNQIGAVVGVQPFGGQGLSGTGPKAGGPHYLYRFVTEKTCSKNTTALGGNTTLLSLGNC